MKPLTNHVDIVEAAVEATGRFCVQQAIIVPLAAMLIPILTAFTLPGYSSISQHISEVALLDHPIAIVQRCMAVVAGASILLFGIGLMLLARGHFGFTAVAAAAFATSMISNGVVVIGSPLHGLYGLGLFMVLVPAFFAAELPQKWHGRRIRNLSMAAALFDLVYMWVMIAGLDPAGFTGLTQRVATVVIFGWYALAGSVAFSRATLLVRVAISADLRPG